MGIRKSTKSQQEPFWKRRIESDIAILRKGLIHLDDWFKVKWKKDKERKEEIWNQGKKKRKLKSLLSS